MKDSQYNVGSPPDARYLRDNDITQLMVIDTPKKIWIPTIVSRYEPPSYTNDIDEGIFLFEPLRRTLFRSTPWKHGLRDNVIHFIEWKYRTEHNIFKIDKSNTGDLFLILQSFLRTYWNCFVAESIKSVMLEYEFGVATDDATSVCCKKPYYGPHESTVISMHTKVLCDNDWIEQFEGGWGSPIVLASKPHQETIVNIENFVWRICVSYRRLNRVTYPFE